MIMMEDFHCLICCFRDTRAILGLSIYYPYITDPPPFLVLNILDDVSCTILHARVIISNLLQSIDLHQIAFGRKYGVGNRACDLNSQKDLVLIPPETLAM